MAATPLPAPVGMLTSSVPPINVLIVEDNIINLKLLEAFVKRLKVRWQTAMNGRDAVTRWRNGGFHLVLMDIQLPVMNGLDATREIRRLERVNSIGVFSSADGRAPVGPGLGEPDANVLPNIHKFKSPVIIVALTASSLQSDRHDALAAGCNDFLTKVTFSPTPSLFFRGELTRSNTLQPVNFSWLERKVKEWGCMQALIDFDGWRKWADYTDGPPGAAGTAGAGSGSANTAGVVGPDAAAAAATGASGTPAAAALTNKKTAAKTKKSKNRLSLISNASTGGGDGGGGVAAAPATAAAS